MVAVVIIHTALGQNPSVAINIFQSPKGRLCVTEQTPPLKSERSVLCQLPAGDKRQPDFPHCCFVFLICLPQANSPRPTPHSAGTIPLETPLLLADLKPVCAKGGTPPVNLPQSLLQDPPLRKHTALMSQTWVPVLPQIGQVALVNLLDTLELFSSAEWK